MICISDFISGVISGIISTTICTCFISVCHKSEKNRTAKLHIKNLSWILWDDFTNQYIQIITKEKYNTVDIRKILHHIDSAYTNILVETDYLWNKRYAVEMLYIIKELKKLVQGSNKNKWSYSYYLELLEQLKELSDIF